MNTIAAHTHRISQDLSVLSDIFRQELGAAYLSNAIYMSADAPETAFSVAHNSDTYKDRQRTGKYVWNRILTPEKSIGVQAHNGNYASKGASVMFKGHHENVHLPLFEEATDTQHCALLQVVFKDKAAPNPGDLQQILNKYSMRATLKGHMQPLLGVPREKRNQLFRLVAPYKRNAIVLYPDINGFKKMSADTDNEQAMNFADQFLHHYLDDIANQFGAKIARYQGDGAWIWMAADDINIARKANLAIGMSKEIMDGFPAFVAKVAPAYAHYNPTLKIVAEFEEVRTMMWNAKGQWAPKPDLSGALYTTIQERTANFPIKNRNQMMIGPNLYGALRAQQDDFSADINDYRLLNFI